MRKSHRPSYYELEGYLETWLEYTDESIEFIIQVAIDTYGENSRWLILRALKQISNNRERQDAGMDIKD